MELSESDKLVRDEILAASDMETSTSYELITEPIGQAASLNRPTYVDYNSQTVQVGKKYRITYMYINQPDSPAWGALAGIDERII